MSFTRGIISMFYWYTQRRGMCRMLHAAIHTIALFSVTSLVILNKSCRLLFVLTVFINRLKSLIQQSSGSLNDSLIYIFSFYRALQTR